MRCRVSRLAFSLAALVAATACGSSSTTSATSASTAASDGGLTASVAAPRPISPGNSLQIANASQPVALAVQNAVVTKTGTNSYTFEIANDAAFTTNVITKTAAEGSNGQTAVKLDILPAGKDYYWHARVTGGGTTGLFGAAYKFTIGPAIAIGTPTPLSPLNGGTTAARPTLRVTNVTRTGNSGPITYQFDLSTTSTFLSIVLTGSSAEGSGETDFTPPIDLPSTGAIYWRATAIDVADGISGTPSAPQSFTASIASQAQAVANQLGVKLWPGAQPPGATGHATMGSDWTVEPITSFDGITFLNPPLDELQIFDLLDRGMSPPDAINWMHANGYSTIGVWYPDVQVIAFAYEYIAYINGQWSIVIRVGA
ncbi:MAG TPA: hypothetical protein VGH34_20150 [Vicinamibacterales bacterium]|jgi:hypothetical protein